MMQNAPPRRWVYRLSFLSMLLAAHMLIPHHSYAEEVSAESKYQEAAPRLIRSSRVHPFSAEDLSDEGTPSLVSELPKRAPSLPTSADLSDTSALPAPTTHVPTCLTLTHSTSFRPTPGISHTASAVSLLVTPEPIIHRTLRVLSLHGGGVRGIMELRFLQQLEAEAGRPISEMFHMIAGTSAGGIIAAALTMPAAASSGGAPPCPRYTADYVFNYMRAHYRDLFKTKKLSCGGLFGPRYRSSPGELLANEFFGDHTFEHSLVDTLITTYDLGASQPRFFKTWDPREHFYTRDVVLSTTAAPTYFKPRMVFPVGHTAASHMGYVLSDGGTFANDPTACLLADAVKRYPDAADIEIVSLGTGITQTPTMYRDVRGAGLLAWGRQAIDVFMQGQTAKCHYLIDSLFPGTFRGHYSYWNPIIDIAHAHLDDTSERNINALILAQDNLIRTRRHEFTGLVERLRTDKYVFTPVNPYTPRGS